MSSESDPFGRKGTSKAEDAFGRPEQTLRDRILASRLGKRTVAVSLSLGLIGGAAEGVKYIVKSGGQTKMEQVSKNPAQDINANPGLPTQLQMGDQRATREGVVTIKSARRDINANPGLPTQVQMGGQRVK